MRQPGLIFLRHVEELDPVPELRMVSYDHCLHCQPCFFDPENNIQIAPYGQREAHFHIASAEAEIGSLGMAGDGCALRFELNCNRGLCAWVFPSLLLWRFVRLLGHGCSPFRSRTPLHAMVPLTGAKEKGYRQ